MLAGQPQTFWTGSPVVLLARDVVRVSFWIAEQLRDGHSRRTMSSLSRWSQFVPASDRELALWMMKTENTIPCHPISDRSPEICSSETLKMKQDEVNRWWKETDLRQNPVEHLWLLETSLIWNFWSVLSAARKERFEPVEGCVADPVVCASLDRIDWGGILFPLSREKNTIVNEGCKIASELVDIVAEEAKRFEKRETKRVLKGTCRWSWFILAVKQKCETSPKVVYAQHFKKKVTVTFF